MTPSSFYQDDKAVFLKKLYNDLSRKSKLTPKEKNWLAELRHLNQNEVAQEEDISQLIEEVRGRLKAKKIKSEKEELLLEALEEFGVYNLGDSDEIIPFDEYFELIDEHVNTNLLRLRFDKPLALPTLNHGKTPYIFQYVASILNIVSERLRNSSVPSQSLEVISNYFPDLMLVIVNENGEISYANSHFLKYADEKLLNIIGQPVYTFLAKAGVLENLLDSTEKRGIELVFENHNLDVYATKYEIGEENGYSILVFKPIDTIGANLEFASYSYDSMIASTAAMKLLKDFPKSTEIFANLQFQVSMEKLLESIHLRAKDNFRQLLDPEMFQGQHIIDFSFVLTNLIDLLKLHSAFASVRFVISIDPEVNVFGNEVVLGTALQILLLKSVHHRKPEVEVTEIHFELTQNNRQIKLEIFDNATGLYPSGMVKLLQDVTPNKHQYGIEFFLVKQILHRMDSKLKITYKKGGGTITALTFPITHLGD